MRSAGGSGKTSGPVRGQTVSARGTDNRVVARSGHPNSGRGVNSRAGEAAKLRPLQPMAAALRGVGTFAERIVLDLEQLLK